MVTFTELRLALLKLGLSHTPVIAHASMRAFGEVAGGADTMMRAVLDSVWALIMPAFTYKTMITPEVGPLRNGMDYGTQLDLNRMAEPFTPDMPADKLMGATAEALRTHPRARRTSHPILSFSGVRAENFLTQQSIAEPFGPLAALAEADGWVVLLGVDHTVNTCIHYAEQLARRKQFIRWALLPDRIIECPRFPGDSAGFEALAPDLMDATRKIKVGGAVIQAMSIRSIIAAVGEKLQADSLALLCSRLDCPRCQAVRESLRISAGVG